jgi:NADH dehydrogenase FAD-containing subunit
MLREGSVRVAVVGGGPAAVETAANVRRLSREAGGQLEILLIAGREVLPGFPPRAERIVRRELAALEVSVRPGARAERVADGGLVVDGALESADVVILATGVVPSRLFADSGLPLGTDGSLAVNEYLHVLGYHNIFGGGDCIWYTPRPLPRAGVFAVREGPVLVHNVRATLEEGSSARLKRFRPGGAYLLLLNLGNERALFWRRIAGFHLVYHGPRAYALKDRIDRGFMHRFGSEADRGGHTDSGSPGTEAP